MHHQRRHAWELLAWRLWLKSRRAVVEPSYVPENEMSRFIDLSDVAIVPRIGGLSSAIPSIAMTFGRMVIAPNRGAYPDYFAGTRNLLYQTGSARKPSVQVGRGGARSTRMTIGRRECDDCLEVELARDLPKVSGCRTRAEQLFRREPAGCFCLNESSRNSVQRH